MKILVFTTDIPPLPGLPTSGTALRTYGIAEGLRCHGHEVLISAPSAAIAGMKSKNDLAALPSEIQKRISEIEQTAFDSFNQADIIADLDPDAVICGHWPAYAARVRPDQPVIVDLAGPHMLERHYQKAPDQQSALLAKLSVLASADYFIVSGPSQQAYFYSYMSRAGISEPDERTITITMPLSPNLPKRKPLNKEGFPRFLFGGVFLPWQDPSAGLRSLAKTLRERCAGSLTLIGGKHPNYDVDVGSYGSLFEELSRNERIEVKPMLPFEKFTDEMSCADIALDVMGWNLERQLAMTIRSTTYLWAGLPTIYNDFADLGSLIKEFDAGWLVNPSDPASLDAVFAEIFESPELVAAKSAGAQRLAAAHFAWDKAVHPLLRLIEGGQHERPQRTDLLIDSPELADFPIEQGKTFQQFFVCRMPGLNSVSCKLATHKRRGCKSLNAKLFVYPEAGLRDVPSEQSKRELLAEAEIGGDRIHDSQWVSITTPPMTDSDGKMFMIELESSETDTNKPNVFPWLAKASPYPLIGAVYAGKRLTQLGLCIRTGCQTKELQ